MSKVWTWKKRVWKEFENRFLKKWKKFSKWGRTKTGIFANGYYQIVVGDAPRYNNGTLHNEDALRVNDVVEIK